jgi:hypothetical protein
MMSDALWAIVQQCWSHEVAERPSMARVVEMMQDANGDLRIAVRRSFTVLVLGCVLMLGIHPVADNDISFADAPDTAWREVDVSGASAIEETASRPEYDCVSESFLLIRLYVVFYQILVV